MVRPTSQSASRLDRSAPSLSVTASAVLFLTLGTFRWFSPLPCYAEQRVALKQNVELDHPTLLLSDLLAENAPDALRQTGRTIVLGHSPMPGASGTIPAAQIAGQLPLELRPQISLPAQFNIHRDGWPLSQGLIEGALARYLAQRAGANLAGIGNLHWDEDFKAALPAPALEVVSASWDRAQTGLDFHLRCAHRDECASFLVHASVSPAVAAMLRAANVTPGLGAARAEAGLHRLAPILVRAGKSAIMTADVEGMHISLPVVALQRGSLGQTVRARDPATRKIFAARVVGEGKLAAVFD